MVDSLRQARLSLLLLSIAGNLCICYVLRALRWMRFSRTPGKNQLLECFKRHADGLHRYFCSRTRRRTGASRADREERFHFCSRDVRRLRAGARFRHGRDGAVIIASYSLLAFERRGLIGGQDSPVMKVARSAGALLLVGVIGLVAFLIYFRHHGGEWLGRKLQHEKWRTGWREKIAALLEGFSDGLQGIRTWGDLGALLGYSAVHWLLVALIYMWTARVSGRRFGLAQFYGCHAGRSLLRQLVRRCRFPL